MIRTLLSAILLVTSLHSGAQTYFYIDAITVSPSAPTTSDAITVSLTGNLSSSGAYIVSANYMLMGNTVHLTVEAADPGGLAVLVPHTEVIPIGNLAAGDYTILVDGTGLLDSASPVQHQFTVTGGGSPCDDLIIDFVRWGAFSDTAVLVHVYNNSTELFDYPGFVLLDGSGDTLANETVNFFGIGQESYHTLAIHPDAVLPNGSFTGGLHLWTGFYDVQACSWEFEIDLCPPSPCDTVIVGLENFGNALTLGDFDWTLLDEALETVAAGQLTLTANMQFDRDTLCLPPAHYTFNLTPAQPSTGGQPYLTVDRTGWLGGPSTPLLSDELNSLEFDFYPNCFDGTNNIPAFTKGEGLRIQQHVNGFELTNLNGSTIGTVEVFDAGGRLVRSERTMSSNVYIDLRGTPNGLVIVRAAGEARRFPWLAQ